jgi:hypothetical protein
MNNFNLIVREESLFMESNDVIGVICFSINDWYFPGENWDDFVATILSWLSYALIKINFKKEREVEVGFMEGCFKVTFFLDLENLCTIQFIEGEKLSGDEEIIHKTITVPFKDLKSEVTNACELLLKMKETKELDFQEEYEELKESYDLLCKC